MIFSNQLSSSNLASDPLTGLPRGRSVAGQAANAQFASTQAIKKSKTLRFESRRNSQGKLFLGVLDGKVREGCRLPDGRPNRWVSGGTPIGLADDRHACTIAGTRAGKGRSALVPNLLSYPGSVVVVDPKGELASLTAEHRANRLYQSVVLFDPFGVVKPSVRKQFSGAYNPLLTIANGKQNEQVSNAGLIADALVTNSSQDSHWDHCARDMIAGLCLHVATDGRYQGRRDLLTVGELTANLLTLDPSNPSKCRIESEMEQNPAANGRVRAVARSFYDRTGGELSSVASNLRKQLDWIGYQQLKDCLRGDTIDLMDLKRKPTSLYINLPAMHMASLSGWLRLVIQMSLAACEAQLFKPAAPVLIMLDEFHTLGKLDCLETAAALMAGFGVKLWIVLQNLVQLKHYRNWEAFLANAGMLQLFGSNDIETLRYISEKLGTTQVFNPSANARSFEAAARGGQAGQSYSLGNHALLNPQEIARYVGRDDPLLRQLILLPGQSPILLQRAFYDKHRLFRNKYSRN